MTYEKTVRVPAIEAARAFLRSAAARGHAARAALDEMARGEASGTEAKRTAFASTDPMIEAAIRDRIAYAPATDDVYVKPARLDAAISTLSAIATAAGGEAARLAREAQARKGANGAPDEAAARKVAAVQALQREAAVLMALAQGAQIAAPDYGD